VNAISAARVQAVAQRDRDLQKAPDAEGLLLRPHMETVFEPQPPGAARGTVVMYHGYTAGPWQYREMAQRFHDAGYNVYVPRLPGHGYVDDAGMGSGARIPAPGEGHEWEAFIERTYQDAASLGAPVYAIGLSGGGNAALRLAQRHPEMAGAVAMAPYLGGDGARGLLFPALHALDAITLHEAGRVLNRIPWKQNDNDLTDATPHTQGSLGQAMEMRQVGARVDRVVAATQIFTVDGDFLSGSKPVSKIFDRSGGAARHGWYRFHADEGVPHAMVSPQQNPHAPLLHDMIFEFVTQGRTFQRA